MAGAAIASYKFNVNLSDDGGFVWDNFINFGQNLLQLQLSGIFAAAQQIIHF